jgi:hypothetical protein
MGAENNWTWPPSMDAVVAAPASHRVLFENDDVRVLEVTIAAGHREPEHTHRDPSVMIIDGPARIRYYRGDTLTFSSPTGHRGGWTQVSWMAPRIHIRSRISMTIRICVRRARTHGRARRRSDAVPSKK